MHSALAFRLMRKRRQAATLLAVMSISLIAFSSPSANADLINGVCKLDMTFTFTAPPMLTDYVGYTITIDEDNSYCILDTLVPTPLVRASGSAAAFSGGTSLAKCGVLAGVGRWDQSFGGAVPSVIGGSHLVSGTWLGATMIVTGFPITLATFTGTIELTPHPDAPIANANQVDLCRSGGNVASIRMLGVQVFNDPVV